MDTKTKSIIFRVCALSLVGALCFGISALFSGRGDEHARESAKETEGDRRETFLFLGTDREAGLCDVIMLASVDYTAQSVSVMQIPRDTYAAYTERSYKKLNGAYASLGGAENMASFLAKAMAIRIDHYVCMGLDSLCAMVDALGGVDVDIPFDMRYSDPEQGLYINFKKGMTHLDGEAAEGFVRYRASYTEGDVGRLDAQKLFCAALLEKAMSDITPATLLRLCNAADGIETDMTVADLVEVATNALRIDKSRIAMFTLPGGEATATESGASYYVLSAPAVSAITERFFGRTAEFDADGVFLNRRYESFKNIYRQYADYELYSIGDISESGVDIKTKR